MEVDSIGEIDDFLYGETTHSISPILYEMQGPYESSSSKKTRVSFLNIGVTYASQGHQGALYTT